MIWAMVTSSIAPTALAAARPPAVAAQGALKLRQLTEQPASEFRNGFDDLMKPASVQYCENLYRGL
jgi:hypothetical protein